MNKRQEQAVVYLKRHLEKECRRHDGTPNGMELVQLEVGPTDYGTLWITAQLDRPSLGEGNLLRVLTRMENHWFVSVGKRGALNAKSYPKSLKQFKGKQFLGIDIH